MKLLNDLKLQFEKELWALNPELAVIDTILSSRPEIIEIIEIIEMVKQDIIETRLKKWRSGMEAVISNLKRGYEMFRCEWKTRARFDAKV